MNSKCIVIIANDPDQCEDLEAFNSVFGRQKSFYLGRAMFFDTLSLCLSIPDTDVIVYYYPESSKNRYEHMLGLYEYEELDPTIKGRIKDIRLFPQQGIKMMQRISNAFEHVFELGYDKSAMIGSYCLALDHHLLNAGFLLLKENDIIIGPSFGGRYYLFGMARLTPGIFDGVTWECNDFYIRLNQNLKEAKAKVQELELSYEVYTPEELNQLIMDIERWRSLGDERTAYHTERCLRAIQ